MNKVLSVLLALLVASLSLFVPTYAHAAVAMAPVPVVIGHAAGKGIAPENTIVGIQKSIDAGADIIEIDVRWSANNNTQGNPGYPVLMHDATVDRTTNGTGNVSSLGLTALTQLLAQDYAPFKTDSQYANVKVPYAWDFFSISNQTQKTLLLDVKVTPGEWGMKKLIEYADRFPGGRDRMIYMASAANIATVKAWFPNLKYVAIEYPPTGRIYTGEYLQSLGVLAYAVPFEAITPAMVTYYHSYGLDVYTWTSDTPEKDSQTNWDRVTDADVDAIITNKVAQVEAYLATR